MTIADYKFEYKHVTGLQWLAMIIRPDGFRFAGYIQHHPNQQPNENVNTMMYNAFMDKNQCRNFWVELEENVTYWVVKEALEEIQEPATAVTEPTGSTESTTPTPS